MSTSKVNDDGDAKVDMKAQRAMEGAKAMAEYIAEVEALRARTARLRELRLAKEAAAESKPIKEKKKPSR
jgi:hypothetical protein